MKITRRSDDGSNGRRNSNRERHFQNLRGSPVIMQQLVNGLEHQAGVLAFLQEGIHMETGLW